MRDDSSTDELITRAIDVVHGTQVFVCDVIEAIEAQAGGGARFVSQSWDGESRQGTTRVLTNGSVFEKAGVTVSIVHGEPSPRCATAIPGDGPRLHAAKVSVALYPANPHVPAAHSASWYVAHGARRWVGGGSDLVPYYFEPEDKEHFHRAWREHCEAFETIANHRRLRDGSDAYFYLPHRGERRGLGGIFFDHMFIDQGQLGHADTLLGFLVAGGIRFMNAYAPLVERHAGRSHTPEQRQWQQWRRGRDAEFRLMVDRDPLFGYPSGEYTEPTTVLLPPGVQWGHHDEPLPGSAEYALLEELRRPVPPLRDFEGR